VLVVVAEAKITGLVKMVEVVEVVTVKEVVAEVVVVGLVEVVGVEVIVAVIVEVAEFVVVGLVRMVEAMIVEMAEFLVVGLVRMVEVEVVEAVIVEVAEFVVVGVVRFPKLKLNNKKSAKDPLWMNNELKNLCRRKRNLWFTCRNTRFSDSLIVNEYKQLNIKIKKLVKQKIREFEQMLAKNSKKNPKAVFAYILIVKQNLTSQLMHYIKKMSQMKLLNKQLQMELR
jgi:hypothetical protein